MIKIGITGIIGSGKTTVSKIMEVLGIPVFYADQEAKLLYSRSDVKEKLKSEFGESLFNSDFDVDFQKLSDIVFSNEINLHKINNIIHPLVKENLILWTEQLSDTDICAYESALLFESNFNTLFDYVISVSCHEDICIIRVMNRSNLTEQEVISRMRMQLSNTEKAERADFVIKNDGDEFLIPQVLEIKQQITNFKIQANHKS